MGTPGGIVTPMFAVTSPQAEPLGHYSNGKIGAAALPTDKALSVFSGPWQLNIDFIRSIMKRADIFCYTESDDPIEANDSLIVIHARYPGRKWIRLPRKADILDVFEGKFIARNVDQFSCDMKLHETKYFYYGSDPAGLLIRIRDLNGKP